MSNDICEKKSENFQKFENVFGELDFFKKKCEVLEKDLFKSQTLNKKNDSVIKKLQEMVQMYGKNTNNTSNTFLLPSEFKSNWETLGKDLIMEAFENIFDNNLLLSNLVQDTIKIIYDESTKTIKEKIDLILKSLNIKEPTCTDKFLMKFRFLFQEYYSNIFTLTEEFYTTVKINLLKVIKSYNSEMTLKRESDINTDIESKGMKTFIQLAFKLSVYMLLHEPQLSMNIPTYEKRTAFYYFYNKSDFMNIEGFAKDKSPCLVILPTPLLRSNFPYQGIKPAVYIESNVTETIRAECEKNKQTLTSKIRSYSSSDFNADRQINRISSEEKIARVNNSNSNSHVNNKEKENASPLNLNTRTSIIHKAINKPGSADFGSKSPIILEYTSKTNDEPEIISNNKMKSYIECSVSALPSQSQSADQNLIKNNKLWKNSYDQPLSLNANKKATDGSTCSKYNVKNKINYIDSNINLNLKSPKENDNEIINLTSELINTRISPNENAKNVSRNSSILESFNNSINKDSLKTNDGNYLKSTRTPVENIPEGVEQNVEDSETAENKIATQIGISNSFGISKMDEKNDQNIKSQINPVNPAIQSKNGESLIRLNLANKKELMNINTFTRDSKVDKNMNLNIQTGNNSTIKKTNTTLTNCNNNQLTYKYSNTISSGNYIKNMNNNININNQLLKTNYEFGNLTRKKNLEKFTMKQSSDIHETTNNSISSNNKLLNDTNYDSLHKTSESNNLPKSSLNRNNSQSDIRSVQNMQNMDNIENIQNNMQNMQTTNNLNPSDALINTGAENTQINSHTSGKSKTIKNISIFNNSPKISYSNKVKTMMDNLCSAKNTVGINTPSISTNNNKLISKQSTLEAADNSLSGHKYDLNKNTLQSGLKINENYDYFNLDQSNTTPNRKINVLITNTESNLNSVKQKEYLESGSVSNRLFKNPQNNINNYNNNQYGNQMLNDMKFNGPKKDEFNMRTSKVRNVKEVKEVIEKSHKEKANSNSNNNSNSNSNTNSNTNSNKNISNMKISDVQFNLNNQNNYILSSNNEELNAGISSGNTNTLSNTLNIMNSNSNNSNNSNLPKTNEVIMRNKIEKYYSKLAIYNNSSPNNKDGLNGLNVQSNNGNNSINTNNFMNPITINSVTSGFNANSSNINYATTYKERIMHKSNKLNIQNFNVSSMSSVSSMKIKK